jgi:hypothetical protein
VDKTRIPESIFPPFKAEVSTSASLPGAIADYLKFILRREVETLLHQEQRILMPSLACMASHFRVSQLTVHDALQVLRRAGYDYELGDMDTPIQIWRLPSYQTLEEVE